MFFAGRFTLSQSSPPVRNATYLRTFFSEFIYVFREILSTSMFFCCSIYIETAQNSREECNEFLYLLFWRLSLCLSRDSLSCDTHSLDLCILFTFIFLYLLHIPPHSFAFHTFYFTPMFSYVYYHAKYFSYSWRRCCSEFYYYFFNFSSQRPHLNRIFLSNVYSFNTMEFAMKHSTNSPIFTNKASIRVVIVWYKWKARMCQSCCFEVGCYPFL